VAAGAALAKLAQNAQEGEHAGDFHWLGAQWVGLAETPNLKFAALDRRARVRAVRKSGSLEEFERRAGEGNPSWPYYVLIFFTIIS